MKESDREIESKKAPDMALDIIRLEPGILEEAEALALLIRETDSNLIAFALYQGAANREMAGHFLKERLPIPVVEFTLSSRQQNPVKLLREVPFQERGCVFFFGIEDALPAVAGYVNFQREAFAEIPHAVVFWVSDYGLRELATKAPDFWAWRSGVFDLRTTSQTLEVMRPLASLPFIFRDREDLERRISLYQELLQESTKQEKPDPGFLSRLHQKLATAFYHLGRLKEAEDHAQEGLALSKQTGDKLLEALALSIMAVLAIELGKLDEAENYSHQALQIGVTLGIEALCAAANHELGLISQLRYDLEKAESWYQKAQIIWERLGLEEEAANTYHQLGIIAEEKKQLEQAEIWYQKARDISERLGLERDAASTYHQLGNIAEKRNQLEQAEMWYQKSLEIKERLGLERTAASTYHQMGMIAEDRREFDQAEDWYLKALAIEERLDLERDLAPEYFHLGNIAQARQQWQEAEKWYLNALDIAERLWQPRDTIRPLLQLGDLYGQQNQLEKALDYFFQAFHLSVKFEMQQEAILVKLAILLKLLGEDKFKSAWQEAGSGQEPPWEALRKIVKTMEEKGKEKF